MDGSQISFFTCNLYPHENGCEFKFPNETVRLSKLEFLQIAEFNRRLFREHVLMLEALRRSRNFSSSFSGFGSENFDYFSEHYAKGLLELEQTLS